MNYKSDSDRKLSCHRETARCFVSSNILLSHSLNVIRNDTIRWIAYEFLLTFELALLCIVSEIKRDICRFFIPHTCIQRSLLGGPRQNIATTCDTKKLERWRYYMVKTFEDISRKYTNVTDTQRDTQTPRDGIGRAAAPYALHRTVNRL